MTHDTAPVDIPVGLGLLFGSSREELSRRISEAAAVALFQARVVSSGKAAAVLGIERAAFWRLLHD